VYACCRRGQPAILGRLLSNHPGPFDPDPSFSLALAFPRYRGAEGAAAFASRLAIETGTLLPAILWRSLLCLCEGEAH
jgi:hypothetical protein